MFLVRLLGGYALFFSLLKIWPKKLSIVTSISLLFLIYPGFLQQPLPLGFNNYLTALTFWIISLTFTIYGLKTAGKIQLFLLTSASIVFQILSLLLIEFFIGMEVLRFLLIIYILNVRRLNLEKVKQTLFFLSPYFISLSIFLFWRILIFKSTRPETDIHWVTQTYYADFTWIFKLPFEIFLSYISTLVFAYFLPIIINFIRVPLENTVISLCVGIISSVFLYHYFKEIDGLRHNANLNSTSLNKKMGRDLLIIGLISILASLIPIIISGRFVRLYEANDRYTLTSMIGVSFVIIGFLLRIPYSFYKWIIIILVVLSVTSHLMNGYFRVLNWDKQKDLWWQLYWRSPNVQNNAMIILDFPPVTQNIPFKDLINKVKWYRFYWVDYQIWAPGNLFFNYSSSPKVHFGGDFLEDEGIVDKVKHQITESITDRNITYIRDFRNSVIVSTPSDTSCLWVLDKERKELPLNANELLKTNVSISDVNKLVNPKPPITPPKDIFGSEPAHDWCYFFQKASLARQLRDWDELSRLKKEVLQKNLKPKDPNEWLPFQNDLR